MCRHAGPPRVAEIQQTGLDNGLVVVPPECFGRAVRCPHNCPDMLAALDHLFSQQSPCCPTCSNDACCHFCSSGQAYVS